MFNSGVLDVVIGLVFIYLLYSLLTTLIQEIIATNFNFRSKILERAVFRMLEDENKFQSRFKSVFYLFKKMGNGGRTNSTTSVFYNHPLIKFLSENEHDNKPSYIQKETFAKVIVDLLRGENIDVDADVRPLIQKSLNEKETAWGRAKIGEETLSYLRSVWIDAKGDVEQFGQKLENWFDLTMNHASEWYKRHTQVLLFFIGFAIAVIFNVDTIMIVNKLEKDPALRQQLVQQADVFAKAYPDLDKQIEKQKAEIEALTAQNTSGEEVNDKKETLDKYLNIQSMRDSLLTRTDALMNIDIRKSNDLVGIGLNSYEWPRSDLKSFLSGFGKSLVGWIITALALSLGAPFWFHLLGKLMKVKAAVSGDEPEKKSKKS